jgi:D-glucosaminate-6-phosphate ammonia-lyase
MSIYDTLGVRTVINVAGPVTRLSGAPLHPEVAAAMAEAAQSCVRIEDLQEAAGRELARAAGAEAGYVTAGAASGLALGAAACIAGLDVAAMDRLPDTTGLRDEIIVQRPHLTAYSHALRLAGATLVEVGYLGFPGQGTTWPWQIESAITARTAAIAYSVGNAPGVVPLAGVVAIAHRHGLPVIVDGAGALPPAENLRALIATGADLVAFSGGKAIGGPQASGILVGRAALIESVALQHQDMDVYPETWTWRARYIESGVLPGPPHHGIGRPMKVGKEEIVGLIVALRRFLARDHDAERAEQERRLATILDAVAGLPGIRAEQLGERNAPRAYPTGVIRIDEQIVEQPVAAIVNALIEGDPPIAVSQNLLHEQALCIVTALLKPGEEVIVAERLRAVLG